jgi:hypothetical protein
MTMIDELGDRANDGQEHDEQEYGDREQKVAPPAVEMGGRGGGSVAAAYRAMS